MARTDPSLSEQPSYFDDLKPRKEQLGPELLDVQAVAALLSCSTRHVYRLADAGRMPPPVKLGALVRWLRRVVEQWLADGCPPVRSTKGGL